MVSANKLFAGAAFTLGIIIAVCQYGPSYATQQQSSSIGPAPITVSITTGGGIFGRRETVTGWANAFRSLLA